MNRNDVSSYIHGLYENRATQEAYLDATQLKGFGEVVDEDVARMLCILVRLSGAHKILEIGTSVGYSTVSMAHAMQDRQGSIITIEWDPSTAPGRRS